MAPPTHSRAVLRNVPILLLTKYYAQHASAGLIIAEDKATKRPLRPLALPQFRGTENHDADPDRPRPRWWLRTTSLANVPWTVISRRTARSSSRLGKAGSRSRVKRHVAAVDYQAWQRSGRVQPWLCPRGACRGDLAREALRLERHHMGEVIGYLGSCQFHHVPNLDSRRPRVPDSIANSDPAKGCKDRCFPPSCIVADVT